VPVTITPDTELSPNEVRATGGFLLTAIAHGRSSFPPTRSFAQTPPPQSAQVATEAAAPVPEESDASSDGALDANGSGFLIGPTKYGEIRIGGYALMGNINQLPADQTFTDHLGNVNVIDPRNDVQFDRVKLDFRGGSPSSATRSRHGP